MVDTHFGPEINSATENPSKYFLNVKPSQTYFGALENLNADPEFEKNFVTMENGKVTWPKTLLMRFEKSEDQSKTFQFDYFIEFYPSKKYTIYSVWGYDHMEREHMQIINKEDKGFWEYINKDGEIRDLEDEEIERMQTRISPTWLIYLQMD
jgi:hypothetical protein